MEQKIMTSQEITEAMNTLTIKAIGKETYLIALVVRGKCVARRISDEGICGEENGKDLHKFYLLSDSKEYADEPFYFTFDSKEECIKGIVKFKLENIGKLHGVEWSKAEYILGEMMEIHQRIVELQDRLTEEESTNTPLGYELCHAECATAI